MIGRNKGFVSQLDDLNSLSMKKNKINLVIENFLKSKTRLAVCAFIYVVSLLNFFFIKPHNIF